MKKLIALLLCCVVVIGLVGCAASQEETTETTEATETTESTEPTETTETTESTESASTEGLVFGYVVNDMSHEWYQNIVKGAQARADELGIELKVADSAMDVATQVNQIENHLAEGVDVEMITPVDVSALARVMADAQADGVPVVSESNVIDGAVTYVGIDNVSGGRKAGEWFVEYAQENNIDPKILIVGLPSFADCRQRVEGFKAALEESGIEI